MCLPSKSKAKKERLCLNCYIKFTPKGNDRFCPKYRPILDSRSISCVRYRVHGVPMDFEDCEQ